MNTFSIEAPNGPISGFEVGEGPPVVLLAGLGSTTRIWGNLPAVMGRNFRVIAIDNRGVGGSAMGRPFTLHGMAEDLEAVLDARERRPRGAPRGQHGRRHGSRDRPEHPGPGFPARHRLIGGPALTPTAGDCSKSSRTCSSTRLPTAQAPLS